MNKYLPFSIALVILAATACIKPGSNWRDPKADKRDRRTYDATFVSFYLRDVGNLIWREVDSVAWNYGMPNTQEAGMVGYFFLQGEKFNMSDPHVQVAYFDRKAEGRRTFDELFSFVRTEFVEKRKAKIIHEPSKLSTYGNEEARYMSLEVPQTSNENGISREKWVSYFYVELDKYYVAFVMTAYDQIRFERMFPLVNDLVGTFERK